MITRSINNQVFERIETYLTTQEKKDPRQRDLNKLRSQHERLVSLSNRWGGLVQAETLPEEPKSAVQEPTGMSDGLTESSIRYLIEKEVEKRLKLVPDLPKKPSGSKDQVKRSHKRIEVIG